MTRGRPFEPGNKLGRGRPKGSRNKLNPVVQRHLVEHADSLILRTIAAALRDDTKSRLWCMNELKQGARPAPKLKLPVIKTPDDIAKAQTLVLEAVANNKCTDAHGVALCSMLGERRKMIETQELAVKVEELERMVKKPRELMRSP
jgi:hypothetical protein